MRARRRPTEMRRLTAIAPLLALLAGCAGAASVPAASAPATSAPASARSCDARTMVDSAGRFQWNGTTYSPVGQTSLKDKDTAGLLFAVGCDGAIAYGLKGMRAECELVVFNADAFDAYAPSPLPAGCPAPVTSSSGHITALPPSLADCPKVPQQKLGQAAEGSMGDVIVVGDSSFVGDSPPTTAVTPSDLGPVQFKVRCSYSELNTVTRQQTPKLRSHDSTLVPAGNPVYALNGWPPSCRLAAQHDGEWHVYLALDPKAGPGIPKACAAGSPTPSQLPSPTHSASSAHEITGTFGTCPSPVPTQSGSAMVIDYADFLHTNGRFYVGDLGNPSQASPNDGERGDPQLTVRCTVSTWSDTYQQGLATEDGDASFLRAGTVVYAVKGHSPLCQLMARTESGWDLFTSTEAGCPSPPPNPSHPPNS
jgi:hypothetical protein